MIKRIRLFFVIFAVLICSFAVRSQTGVISGVVQDSKTKETIIGANVLLTGTLNGASTDLDGKFVINGLKPGTYSLTVSYISYKTLEIPNVKVESGKVTSVTINIEDVSTALSGVTITGSRKTDTEISMISMIKSSELVVSGISTQQIQRTQDRDASEVIKRVPGINIIDDRFVVVRGLSERYNVVWLNNVSTPSSESDVKAFSFDNIPSSMIDRIMIYKTPAPELPGDFAGGAVQIFTRNNPQKNALDISLSTSYRSGTTLNDFYMYKGGSKDWLGYDDGTRALPLGFPDYTQMIEKVNSQDQADQDFVTKLGREMNKNWTAQLSKASPDIRFSSGFSYKKDFKKVVLGNITALNYTHTNALNDIFRADYLNYDTVRDVSDTSYHFKDKQYTTTAKIGILHNWSLTLNRHTKLEFRNLFNQIGFTRTTIRDGRDNYGGITLRAYEYRFMSRSIYSGQFGGEHKYNDENTKFNWTVGYSFANRKEPDQKRLTTVLSEEDPSDPHYGKYAVQLSTAATPELTGRLYTDMDENIYNIAFNYEQKLSFGNFRPELKTGFYYEKKDRRFNARNIGYRIARTSQFNYEIPYLPFDSLFMDANINSTTGIKLDEKTNASDSYTADNLLIAAYISLKIPITASLNLYTGARVEKNREQLNSFQIDKPTVPVNVDNDTINIFPSFNFAYTLGERSLIRLAYGMTVNRPEFREIAPMLFYDFEKKAGIRGNPDLVNGYIHNYDLRYEFYPSLSELFTLGVFYKKFIHPIETKVIPAGSGIDYSFDNAESAYDYGAEIEFKKTLDNLSGTNTLLNKLKHFSLLFNATAIKSTVKFEKGNLQDNRPLQGQSPYIVNVGIYYNNDSTGWMFSVMYNVIGKRIVFVGDPYSGNPDTYEMPRNVVDLTVKKSIGKHLEFKGGIQDMFSQNVRYQQTIKFNKDTNGDGNGNVLVSRNQTLLSYKPGAYYTLGISFKF